MLFSFRSAIRIGPMLACLAAAVAVLAGPGVQSRPCPDPWKALGEMELAYRSSAVRAGKLYCNRTMTFEAFVHSVRRHSVPAPRGQSERLVLFASRHALTDGTAVGARIELRPLAVTPAPGDLVTVTATMKQRIAAGKGDITRRPGFSRRIGWPRGGADASFWVEYSFVGGVVQPEQTRAEMARKAAEERQAYERPLQEAAAAMAPARKAESARPVLYGTDSPFFGLRGAFRRFWGPMRGIVMHTWYQATSLFYMDAVKSLIEEGVLEPEVLCTLCIHHIDDKSRSPRVSNAYRYLIGLNAPSWLEDWHTPWVGGRAVKARRPVLLKVLLDSENFDPKVTLGTSLYHAMVEFRREAQGGGTDADQQPGPAGRVTLEALDVEMLEVALSHPRCKGLEDYVPAEPPAGAETSSFRSMVHEDKWWVENDELKRLRALLPEKAR